MKRLVISALSVLVLASSSAWSAERPVSIRGVRPLGMGNAFTAIADDQNAFFYNPAGSVQRTGSLVTVLEIPATVGTDLLDAYDFISDNEDKMKDFDKQTPAQQIALINDIDRTMTPLNPHFGVGGPNSSYLSGPIGNGYHWGFGVFGQAEGSFRLNGDIIPNLDYDVNWDIAPVGNFSKRWENVWKIPGKVSAGTNLKYIQRSQIKESRVSFLQLDDFESPPLQRGTGFGMDIGALYQPNDRWNFGLTSFDFLGTSLDFDSVAAEKGFLAKESHSGTIKPRWNVGAAWTPSRLSFWPGKGLSTGNRLILAADVKDIFNSDSQVLFDNKVVPDTFWPHLHVGAEYRWWFLRLRLGANQGYTTYGLGLDIPLLKLDYAYYADELSRFSGGLKQANHMISLSLRFGSGKTEARDRVKSVKASSAASAPSSATTATEAVVAPTETISSETPASPEGTTPAAPAAQ